MLRFCINERELPGLDHRVSSCPRLTRKHALLCAAGLLSESSEPAPSLRLGIRRYSGEIACLYGRTLFYEFAESYAP
jgi:hypothetical protein